MRIGGQETTCGIVGCAGLFCLVAGFGGVALVAWILQVAWAFVLPKVAPGAIASGLLAPTIGFWVAFVIVIVIQLLFAGIRTVRSSDLYFQMILQSRAPHGRVS